MYRGRKTTAILLVCFLYLGAYSAAHAQSSSVVPTVPSSLDSTSVGTDANSACIYDGNKQKLVWVSNCIYPNSPVKGSSKICGAMKQCSGKKVIGGKSLQVTGHCEFENECRVETFIDENGKVQNVSTPDGKLGETKPSTEVPKETDTAADVPKTDPDKQYTPVKCSFGDCKAVPAENQYTPVSCSGGTCEATKISPSASKLQDWLGGDGVAQSSPYSGQSILDNYWSNFTYEPTDFGDLTDYGVPTTYDEFGNAAYDTSGTNFTSPESTGFTGAQSEFYAPDDLGPTASEYAGMPNGTDFPNAPIEPVPYLSSSPLNPWAAPTADYISTLPPSLGGTGPAISGLTDIPASPGFPSATAANANWSGANDPLPYAWASYAQTNPAAPLPSAADQLAQFTSPNSSGQFDSRSPDLVNTTETPSFGQGIETTRLPIAARDLSYDSFASPGAWKFAQPGSTVDWAGDVKNYGDFVAVNIGKVGDWVYGENTDVIAQQEQERQVFLAAEAERQASIAEQPVVTAPESVAIVLPEGVYPPQATGFALNDADTLSDAEKIKFVGKDITPSGPAETTDAALRAAQDAMGGSVSVPKGPAAALSDAVKAFGEDRKYAPDQIDTVTKGLGGVAQQESGFNPDTPTNRAGYGGFGQLSTSDKGSNQNNETIAARDTLADLAQSPNLSPDTQSKVQGIVNKIDGTLAAGGNPNMDAETGPWLLAARQAEMKDIGASVSPMDIAAKNASTPQEAAAIMQGAQLAPSMYSSGYNPDAPLTVGQRNALSANLVNVRAGQTVGQALESMQNSNIYSKNFDIGVSKVASLDAGYVPSSASEQGPLAVDNGNGGYDPFSRSPLPSGSYRDSSLQNGSTFTLEDTVPLPEWRPASAPTTAEQSGKFALDGLGGDSFYGPQSQAEVQAVLNVNDQRLINVAREQGLADQRAAEFDATAQAQADLMAQNDAYDAQIAAQQQLKVDENSALADRIALAEAQNPAPLADNRPWWQKLISPTPATPAVDTKAVALVDSGALDSGLSKDFNPDAVVSPADQRLIDIARTQGLADQQANDAAQLADQRAVEFDSTARAQADLMAQNDAYASEVAAQQQLKEDENRYLADRIALAEAQNPAPPADNRSWWEKLISPNPTVVDSNIVTSSLAPKPLSTEDDGTVADWNAGYAAVPSTPKASEYYGPEFTDAFGTSPKAIAADVPLPTERPDIVVSGVPLPAARPAAADDAQALSSLNFDYPSNDPIRWESVKSSVIADAKQDGLDISYSDSSKAAEYYGPEPTDAFGSSAQTQVKTADVPLPTTRPGIVVSGIPLPTARPDIVVSDVPLPTARPDIAENNVPLPLARPEIVVSGIPFPTARPDSAPANLARIALEAGSAPTPSELQTGIDYSGGTELTTAESDAAFKQFQAQQGTAADDTSYAGASESVLVKKRDIIAAGDSGSAENTPEYKAYVAANGVAPANLQQLGEWSDKNPDAVAKQAPVVPAVPSSTWSTAGAITTGKGVVVGGVIGGTLTCWTGALCPVGIGVGASLGGYFSNTNESKARTSIEFGTKPNAGDVSTVIARDVTDVPAAAPATPAPITPPPGGSIELAALSKKDVDIDAAAGYKSTARTFSTAPPGGNLAVAPVTPSAVTGAPAPGNIAKADAAGASGAAVQPVQVVSAATQGNTIYNPALVPPVSPGTQQQTILNPANDYIAKLQIPPEALKSYASARPTFAQTTQTPPAAATPVVAANTPVVTPAPSAPQAPAAVPTQNFAYNSFSPVVQPSYYTPVQTPVSQLPLSTWASPAQPAAQVPIQQVPASVSAGTSVVPVAIGNTTKAASVPVAGTAQSLAQQILALENQQSSDAALVRASTFLTTANTTAQLTVVQVQTNTNANAGTQAPESNNGTSLVQLKPTISIYVYPNTTHAVVHVTNVIPANRNVAIIKLGNVLIDADQTGMDALKKAYDEKSGTVQVYVSKSDLGLLEMMSLSGVAPDSITVYPVPILPGGIAVQVGRSGDIQEMFTAELLSFGSTGNSANTTGVSYVNWSPGTGQTLVPSALNKGATGALSENENQNAVTAQNTFGGSSASSTVKTSVTGNTLYNLVQTIQSTFSFIFGK